MGIFKIFSPRFWRDLGSLSYRLEGVQFDLIKLQAKVNTIDMKDRADMDAKFAMVQAKLQCLDLQMKNCVDIDSSQDEALRKIADISEKLVEIARMHSIRLNVLNNRYEKRDQDKVLYRDRRRYAHRHRSLG